MRQLIVLETRTMRKPAARRQRSPIYAEIEWLLAPSDEPSVLHTAGPPGVQEGGQGQRHSSVTEHELLSKCVFKCILSAPSIRRTSTRRTPSGRLAARNPRGYVLGISLPRPNRGSCGPLERRRSIAGDVPTHGVALDVGGDSSWKIATNSP